MPVVMFSRVYNFLANRKVMSDETEIVVCQAGSGLYIGITSSDSIIYL
jgi:hypothetical protein